MAMFSCGRHLFGGQRSVSFIARVKDSENWKDEFGQYFPVRDAIELESTEGMVIENCERLGQTL